MGPRSTKAARPCPAAPVTAARAAQSPEVPDDPFDRLLIGQALCEDMVLMTRDGQIRKYDVPVYVV